MCGLGVDEDGRDVVVRQDGAGTQCGRGIVPQESREDAQRYRLSGGRCRRQWLWDDTRLGGTWAMVLAGGGRRGVALRPRRRRRLEGNARVV